MITAAQLPLDKFYQHEVKSPNKTYLVQPLPGGEVQNLSWAEVGDQARRAAAWLGSLNLPKGSRVAIVSKNCAHWIIADLAIWMAGCVSVPLYPNLTAESANQVLTHAETAVAFIGKLDDWPGMSAGMPEKMLTVALPLHPEGHFDYHWADLQTHAPMTEKTVTTPNDLATIIYTSGTTGMPKGVMHSFSNFAFASSRTVALFDLGEEDRLLSYLPLCHVAERMFVEMASLYAGETIFFAENLETFAADLRRARPTALFGVPRIWTKFQMGVYARVPAKVLDEKLEDPQVGQQVLAELGLDAVRIALCGAAPVPEALLNWYQRLGLSVMEVYGMTENCGYSHICRLGEHIPGWIGRNSPDVEVRITEEGEVQVRSGANMLGYYKDPERTAETFTEDGFLRTGDKGVEDIRGNLRLTGRIKEIFKTAKGKYVAPAPIENRLAVHPRIEQVCVVGDGLVAPLGLCVLSEAGRQEATNDAQALESSLSQLLEEVNQVLEKHERLEALVLVKDIWTVDNGFLTPTLKIKRNVIEMAYGKYFNDWSGRRQAVLWHD